MDANALDNELLKLSLSPIAPWVDDPEVTDILVYGSRNVYVRRRGGGFEGVGASWLSDADLMMRSTEVEDLAAKVKGLWDNKLSLIPEFYDRLTTLNQKVKSLQSTLAGKGMVYTVGTWRHDRDCLWNISKKKDIYDNAWWWPKIWQGNRDQIRDPDVIHQGQKLKIPKAGPLTADEKRAVSRYYGKKRQ